MKILLLIMFLLNSYVVMADGCFKKFCVGHVVRDNFGWKGTVSGFDIENEMVSVDLHHVPSTWKFPYKELGRQRWCFMNFCTGEFVIDKYGDRVRIEEIYDHDMVYVFDDTVDGFFLYKISEITKIPDLFDRGR